MKTPKPRALSAATPLASAMTPMIDVVFLLLVFFLCTASFDRPEENLAASLIVESTEAGAGQATTEPPELDDVTIVGATTGGVTAWTLNEGRTTTDLTELTGLLQQLAAIDRALPVTIDAGPDVPMRDVVGAYDAARSAGFGRVLLAASADAGGTE
ncbi:Biopolymer transport protein ExbD/TolR [Planctomycetes bacterium MalM25]|nr:Biopolymer transport protein ExbD/TolR [Planctomycetes bacterium MalM25]